VSRDRAPGADEVGDAPEAPDPDLGADARTEQAADARTEQGAAEAGEAPDAPEARA
jgi:hypothetical protein